LIYDGKDLVGAIGVSGSSSGQDEQLAIAGIESHNLAAAN